MTSATSANPVVDARNLTKRYRASRQSTSRLAIDDVSLAVHGGEVVALLGVNGAGKTTTIKCLCALVQPDSGSISVGGIDVLASPRAALAHVAAVLEGSRNVLWRLTARENLELFASLHGRFAREAREDIDRLLELFGLQARNTTADRLSRGMQQKLSIACALVKRTSALLLDEPTLGLDVGTVQELRGTLQSLARREGRAVVISSHDMEFVQSTCDRVVIIHDGRVVANDSIKSLLDVFRARAYRICVSEPLSDAQTWAMRKRFASFGEAPPLGATEFQVDFPGDRDLYDLIDLLRHGGTSLKSIQRCDPNLAQIFLSVTGTGQAE